MPEVIDKSEWSEQIKFSTLYFLETCRSKEAMRDGKVHKWRMSIDIKISLAMMIATTKDEMATINNVKITINECAGEVRKKPSLIGEFYNVLFESEMIIDQLVNKRMHFLKIEDEGGSDDW